MEEIEDNVLSLYTHGMSTGDIESTIKELYRVEMSEAHTSHITDRFIKHIEQWKQCRLEKSIYGCVNGCYFKVRQEGKIVDKAVQIVVGLNHKEYKEVLGMWLCSNESASFWITVLADLKTLGMEDYQHR